MKVYYKKLLMILAVPLVLSACDSGVQLVTGPAKKKAAAVAKPAEAEAPKPEAEAVKSEPPLKNPFQSYILLKRGEIDKTAVIKGPLECCEIATFKVVAALVAGEKPYALLSGPDNKRYIVRIGDKIGLHSGKIVAINTSGITVREIFKDIDGNVINTNDVKLEVFDSSGDSGAPKSPRR
ncbi:MAG: hypothetical protein A3J24_10185 [Deltaproteobacteria bacterium RIFCSPLOWO2_02_FULL_53_8]|nr:MAG: hypothetical protein A3J24_10185 [Deltaproteobacteria bacterium RIFCSPLOWO2_02_FULL_53_8]